jgi:hypothetical protein
MLLQEAEQMHQADRQGGRPDEEVLQRLRDSIDCARQLYAQRAALEGPAAAALFDDHVLGTIDVQAGTTFARDLAAAVGHIDGGQRAAEAS